MFGSSRQAVAVQQAAIASELVAIREGVGTVRSELSAIASDVKHVRSEQNRHEDWIRRIEADIVVIRPAVSKVQEIDVRLGATESKISELGTWRAVDAAKWSLPQKVIAVIASVIPICAILWNVMGWLARSGFIS